MIEGDAAGIYQRIASWLDAFDRLPETRIVMEAARRAGIPYSEARQRWSDAEDIAAELAWDMRQAAEQLRRCPSCGTDPAEIQDPDTRRLLEEGALQIRVWDCMMCQHLARHEDDIPEQARKMGTQLRIMPRPPGEPFFVGFDTERT